MGAKVSIPGTQHLTIEFLSNEVIDIKWNEIAKRVKDAEIKVKKWTVTLRGGDGAVKSTKDCDGSLTTLQMPVVPLTGYTAELTFQSAPPMQPIAMQKCAKRLNCELEIYFEAPVHLNLSYYPDPPSEVETATWTRLLSQVMKPIDGIPVFNVAVFGPEGTGKSAFMNSVETALNSGGEFNPTGTISKHHLSRNQQGHVTQRLGVANIKPSCILVGGGDRSRPAMSYHFWDSWGAGNWNSMQTWNPNQIARFLQGHLKEGYARDMDPLGISQYVNQSPTLADRMHLVVFVLAANELDGGVAGLGKTYDTFRDCGVTPLVLVSKVDTVDSSLLIHPEKARESATVISKMGETLRPMGIAPTHWRAAKFYHSEVYRSVRLETALLQILMDIKQHCHSFVERALERGEQFPRQE